MLESFVSVARRSLRISLILSSDALTGTRSAELLNSRLTRRMSLLASNSMACFLRSDPRHRRCGVGYYTDTAERVFCALPGLRQSVYRAELHAIARALKEFSPHEVVSDCKGAVKAVQALQTGQRQPKGRNRDLELR
eukprot:1246630-Amphidinium_carterae.1